MLRCIRCGACLNHCPVYGAIGGHAYGSLYPGPMGAVLTPALYGIDHARDLPNASSFCGRCEEVCPMAIPLPSLMRAWRERDFDARRSPRERLRLKLWAFAAKRPRLYRALGGARAALARLAGAAATCALPFAGAWTGTRDLPAPEGKTFHALSRRREGADEWTATEQPCLDAGAIRKALGAGDDSARKVTVAERLRGHPRGTIPARALATARRCSSS